MQIKDGVTMAVLRPQIVLALLVAERVYDEYHAELVVTSLCDGKHKVGSLHYKGDAADLRIWNLPGWQSEEEPGVAPVVAAKLQSKLGDNYDVVLEKDHIHMEFDPT